MGFSQALVDTVDLEEVLRIFGSAICRVDFEGLGNTVLGDFDGFAFFFIKSTVGEGGGEEINDGEGETLFGGCHDDVLVDDDESV